MRLCLVFDKTIGSGQYGDSRAYLINSREIEQITYDRFVCKSLSDDRSNN